MPQTGTSTVDHRQHAPHLLESSQWPDRSHASRTTTGGHADLLSIAEELVPFVREALATSSSELVFPQEDGSQHPPDLALHKVED
jgi:hypothetical protein